MAEKEEEDLGGGTMVLAAPPQEEEEPVPEQMPSFLQQDPGLAMSSVIFALMTVQATTTQIHVRD